MTQWCNNWTLTPIASFAPSKNTTVLQLPIRCLLATQVAVAHCKRPKAGLAHCSYSWQKLLGIRPLQLRPATNQRHYRGAGISAREASERTLGYKHSRYTLRALATNKSTVQRKVAGPSHLPAHVAEVFAGGHILVQQLHLGPVT